MQSWRSWQSSVDHAFALQIEHALRRAEKFLAASQRADGAWIPLWFGNEHAPAHENPVYGTARTLIALNELQRAGFSISTNIQSRAEKFLRTAQNANGGWGGDSGAPESIEETALSVEALNDARGAMRLVELLESQNQAAPIGLYFARLWYFEKLYPLIFATSALGSIASKQL
jgi:squalene-hopene/tetraprenyl-beta-curcumene cyclase